MPVAVRRSLLRRRVAAVTALVAVVLLCLPSTAMAEPTVAEGAVTVQDLASTTIEIVVERGRNEEFREGARVRAVDGVDDFVALECTSGCDNRSSSRTYALTYDPRTGAPLFDGTPANGVVELDVRVPWRQLLPPSDDEASLDFEVMLDVPASPVAGLEAEAGPDEVQLRWSRALEPDVRYRIERTDASGRTDELDDELGPGTEGFTDAADPGTYTYSVHKVRPGTGGRHETAATIEVTVPEPETTPPSSGDDETSRPPAGDDEPQPNNGGNGGNEGSGGGANGSTGSPPADSGGSSEDRPRPEPTTPRAPTIELEERDIPSLSDDEGFAGELDYGEVGDEDDVASPDRGGDEVVLAEPGRGMGGSVVDRLTDPERVAIPIAGGLLLTAIGLHLWRWLRVPLG